MRFVRRARMKSHSHIEHFQIYPGRVTSITAFGAFVQVEHVQKKWEGLVHISQLRREGRVTTVSEVVTRGQKVKVRKAARAILRNFFVSQE